MDGLDLLGRGWAFPPAFSKQMRSVAMTADIENVRQSLYLLLQTAPGERVMLPTYGTDLARFFFREPTAATLDEIGKVVATAIRLWEPRIELMRVAASLDAVRIGLILIDIEFLVLATGSRSNMIFPFYLSEALPEAADSC
jgi:phage baseplate assembly protein W